MRFVQASGFYLLFISFALALPGQAVATSTAPTAQLEALEIVDRVNAVPECDNLSRKLSMKMIDRRGKERHRETLSFRKRKDGQKNMALFYLAPANVRDTALLTYDYEAPEATDDQWIYLPALRKARRISAANRGDYFLGTDFTYEDTMKEGKIEAADFTFSRMTAESPGEVMIEALPRSAKIARELGYGKLHIWVDPDNWLVNRASYWDARLKPLKDIRFAGARQVSGYWVRDGIIATNHKTGHRTEFHFSDIDCTTPLDDALFSRQSLGNGAPL